jgi:hypothetical protein
MSWRIVVIAVFGAHVVACKQREADPGADISAVDAAADAPPPGSGTGGAGLKPLALGCSDDAECASGFCVDGVCCDSACDAQCSVCNVVGNVGYCTGQLLGDDTTSIETCTGAHTCAITIPSLNLAPCRLKTLQACKTNSDCASLLCQTFYVDHDGDGYGGTSATLRLCEVDGATPPVGYAAQGGDCCDTDANAFPGQVKYFGVKDACGSWDYSCDGKVVSQSGAPTQDCGQQIQQGDSSEYETVYCR